MEKVTVIIKGEEMAPNQEVFGSVEIDKSEENEFVKRIKNSGTFVTILENGS